MPRKTMIEAIRDAMDVMMGRDEKVVVFGEDVGFFGGVFRCTQGLQAKYGKSRCFDAPISESGIVGAAIGMAAYGLRPCVEVQFADYVYPAYDQIVSEAARLRYRSNGDFTCPIVVRMPTGGGIFGGQTHSQSPEALFTHVSGLKTVVPSNPYDAKGLLIAAIEDPDPVIFLEPKRLYNGPFDGHHDRPVTPWSKHELSEVPDGHYSIPLGKAVIRRAGCSRHRARLWHHGLCRAGRGRGDRHRRRGDRSAHAAAARPRNDRRVGQEDRPLRGRARGDADLRLRRRACRRSSRRTASTIWRRRSARVAGWDTPYPHAQEWDYFPGPARVGRALSRNDGGVSMGEHVIKLPDVGEGVAEAELVEWHVKVGDLVREDALLAAVMTDKATVEIPSPVDGEVLWLGAEIGDTRGGRLADRAAEGGRRGQRGGRPPPRKASAEPKRQGGRPRRAAAAAEAARRRRQQPKPAAAKPAEARQRRACRGSSAAPRGRSRAPTALPGAARARAKSRWPRRPCGCAPGKPASICARSPAAGPAGRITHEDLEAFLTRGPQAARAGGPAPNNAVEDIKIVGLRRKIAEKMALAKSRIPHITYVEEIDVTALEELRAALNKEKRAGPAEADAAAVPDAGHGQGDRRAARR